MAYSLIMDQLKKPHAQVGFVSGAVSISKSILISLRHIDSIFLCAVSRRLVYTVSSISTVFDWEYANLLAMVYGYTQCQAATTKRMGKQVTATGYCYGKAVVWQIWGELQAGMSRRDLGETRLVLALVLVRLTTFCDPASTGLHLSSRECWSFVCAWWYLLCTRKRNCG